MIRGFIFFACCRVLPLIIFGGTVNAAAVTYECKVTKKLMPASGVTYTHKQLEKFQPSLVIIDTGESFALKRCSFAPSQGKVTCDEYEGDKKVVSTVTGSPQPIKKYYYFQGQFDVQVFQDLSFIENNGRGQIALGKCRML